MKAVKQSWIRASSHAPTTLQCDTVHWKTTAVKMFSLARQKSKIITFAEPLLKAQITYAKICSFATNRKTSLEYRKASFKELKVSFIHKHFP